MSVVEQAADARRSTEPQPEAAVRALAVGLQQQPPLHVGVRTVGVEQTRNATDPGVAAEAGLAVAVTHAPWT